MLLLSTLMIAAAASEAAWPLELIISQIVLLVGGAAGIVYLLQRIKALQQTQEGLAERLHLADKQAAEAQQRLAVMFRFRQQLLAADRQEDVIEALLPLAIELSGAEGASYVPLDEHGQPRAAIRHGHLPQGIPDAWVEYLASPAVRSKCSVCDRRSHQSGSCPLLEGPFTNSSGVWCLPLTRSERELGVLNLFLPRTTSPPAGLHTGSPVGEQENSLTNLTAETQAFLQSLLDEASLTLEGIWLRQRELGVLRQTRLAQEKTELSALLQSLLEDVRTSLEASYVRLVVKSFSPSHNGNGKVAGLSSLEQDLVSGELLPVEQRHLEDIIQSVAISGNTLNRPRPAQVERELGALIAVPVLSFLQDRLDIPDRQNKPEHDSEQRLGVLAAGKRGRRSFNPRQLALLERAAMQIALAVQASLQLSEIQVQTMMAERTRLAREIHDGLAQTLGFLKLQTAQMQIYLERGELARLKQSVQTAYAALADAYQDARYAIDGLRISPEGEGFQQWLDQILSEFQDDAAAMGLQVRLGCMEEDLDLPPEVQAQMIRIVQEALSNVRKHAHASQVIVSLYRQENDLILEIRDDGRGFDVADVLERSQHGLRGMRERAELIGGGLTLTSHPGRGTAVRVHLPIRNGETAV